MKFQIVIYNSYITFYFHFSYNIMQFTNKWNTPCFITTAINVLVQWQQVYFMTSTGIFECELIGCVLASRWTLVIVGWSWRKDVCSFILKIFFFDKKDGEQNFGFIVDVYDIDGRLSNKSNKTCSRRRWIQNNSGISNRLFYERKGYLHN